MKIKSKYLTSDGKIDADHLLATGTKRNQRRRVMGEYAEDQLRFYYRRVCRDSFYRQAGRNPIAGRCPHCGKGIRPLRGQIEESMAAHVKAKHPEQNGAKT